jgi:hypothetical protein
VFGDAEENQNVEMKGDADESDAHTGAAGG